jgi:nucleotide-binding universal stress UspA family protein
LHVVHVVSTVPEAPYPRSWEKEKREALLERKKLRGLEFLDGLVRRIEEEIGGNVAGSHYSEGTPDKDVVRLGEKLDAGLIVVGGRRPKWLERFFLARFPDKVLRRAKCPVLVVGERGSHGSPVARRP